MAREAVQKNPQGRTATQFKEIVVEKEPLPKRVHLRFARGRSLLVSEFLGSRIGLGDEVQFAVPNEIIGSSGPELLIKRSGGGFLYQVTLGPASDPRIDKHSHSYVLAPILNGALGFTKLHYPCAAIRDYFYMADQGVGGHQTLNLYDLLKVNRTASLGDLRLAYRLSKLEIQAAKAPARDQAAITRAFNILALPQLRTCHDALMKDPQSPALFPFGGLGEIVAMGLPLKDCFFVHKILVFWPERAHRQIKVPLRQLDYFSDHAEFRNTRSKLGMTLDPVLLPIRFDPSWNQWKHLLAGEIQVEADFVKTAQRREQGPAWKYVVWETALASYMQVKLPQGINEAVKLAKERHHRFGRYSQFFDLIREKIETVPVEKSELMRMLAKKDVPADFDVSQLIWQGDYDPFYYQHLSERSSRVFLFKREFIFLTENAVVVETPRIGHATYLFAHPRSLEQFLRHYVKTTKDAILRNQQNCAEYLGFQGRIVHGHDQQNWLNELRKRLGEPIGKGVLNYQGQSPS